MNIGFLEDDAFAANSFEKVEPFILLYQIHRDYSILEIYSLDNRFFVR